MIVADGITLKELLKFSKITLNPTKVTVSTQSLSKLFQEDGNPLDLEMVVIGRD